MTHKAQRQIAVVGGGVAGLSVAWRLAVAGADVTVVEAQPMPPQGGPATWASAGMICADLEMLHAPPAVRTLAHAARAAWPEFAAQLDAASGVSCGYTRRGAIQARLSGEAACAESPPGDVEIVSAAQARRLEPGLSDDVADALWAPEEAHVGPRRLLRSLAIACQTAGARLIERRRVARLLAPASRVAGIATDDGLIEADAVVLAAGAWSGEVLAGSGVAGPQFKPIKGQMIALDGVTLPAVPTRPVWSAGCYIVPHGDGRIVIGASQEDVGFEPGVDDHVIDGLRRAAERVMPGLAEAREVERFAGFRPAVDDLLPLVGGLGVEGLTIIGGQYRNGILFAPLLAGAAARHALGEGLPASMEPFSASRFGDRRT